MTDIKKNLIPEDFKQKAKEKIKEADKPKDKQIKRSMTKALILEKVKIPDLVNLDSDNKCICPFRGNTPPNRAFVYYPHSETWNCFHPDCSGGDVINLFQELNNIPTYNEALFEMAKQYNIPFGKIDEKFIEREKEIQELFLDFMEKCHTNPEFQEKYKLIEMKKRGFTEETIESFKIGLFDNSIKKYMNTTYSNKLLQDAGFKDYSKKDKAHKGKLYWRCGKRIVYPYFDQNDNPRYFIYRVIDQEPDFVKDNKYMKQMKTEYVKEIPFGLNSIYLLKKKPLIITEGMTDAISVIQAKYPCLSPITVRIKKEHIEKMINYCKRFDKVVVINDNEKNQSGLEGAINTLKVLIKHGINGYIGLIPNPENLDKIDLDDYLKPDLENIEDKNTNKLILDSLKDQTEKIDNLIEDSTFGFDFLIKQIDPNHYIDSDIMELLELIPDGNYSILTQVYQKIKEHIKIPKKYLEEIHKKLRLQLKSQKVKEKEFIDKKVEINQKTDKKVKEFLDSEEKFDIIKQILDYRIVKEVKNKLLVFLLLSGAYINKYQIIIAIGESTGGKSHIAENVIEVFPKEHTWTLTGASDRALIYKEWDKEKIMHIPEAHRNPEILENLKDFGDQGIFYYTVEKNEENRFETREIIIGRKSVILTTTIEGINSQLENRAWKIEPEHSKEQTENIIDNSITIKEDLINTLRLNEQQIKKENLLKSIFLTLEKEYDFDDIEIPYLREIKEIFNTSFLKIRRDHKKFLDLLDIITSWNYKIREYYEIGNRKILLSHPNDLLKALEIGEEIFMNLAQNLTPEKIKIINCFQNIPLKPDKKKEQTKITEYNDKGKKDQYYTTGEIFNHFKSEESYKKSKKTLRNSLNFLAEVGYLEKEKKGRDNKYKLIEGNILKPLDESKKEEICIKSLHKYNQRKEDLKSMNNIKFH